MTERSTTIACTNERNMRVTARAEWKYPFKQAYTPQVRLAVEDQNGNMAVVLLDADELLALAAQVQEDLERSKKSWRRD